MSVSGFFSEVNERGVTQEQAREISKRHLAIWQRSQFALEFTDKDTDSLLHFLSHSAQDKTCLFTSLYLLS